MRRGGQPSRLRTLTEMPSSISRRIISSRPARTALNKSRTPLLGVMAALSSGTISVSFATTCSDAVTSPLGECASDRWAEGSSYFARLHSFFFGEVGGECVKIVLLVLFSDSFLLVVFYCSRFLHEECAECTFHFFCAVRQSEP
jgi:hypothetical protein